MSAFIVSKEHIDAMVTVFLNGPKGNPVTGEGLGWERNNRNHVYITQDMNNPTLEPDELGQMLWRENYKSVMGRYPDCTSDNLPGPNDFSPADIAFYTYRQSKRTPTVWESFGMLSCYEYQSCEHEEWQTSAAKRFVEVVKDRLIRTLPGSKLDHTWEWTAA